MTNGTPERRVGAVWLLVTVLAFVALALSLWDVLVERDGGENWLTQVVLPLLLFVYALVMYARWKRRSGGA
jgi:ABC-type uncharacterized transport system involved in gliding motility auxiliary subunit